jgi:hypothetical protein
MEPAPRQKAPQISPIFKADTVRLHVSREKDGKLRLGYAGMGRYEGRSAGRLRASLAGGWKGETYPPNKAMTPLKKLRPPSGPPLVFSSYGCRSRASNRAFFVLVFGVALPVTPPTVMRNGSRTNVGASTCLSSGPTSMEPGGGSACRQTACQPTKDEPPCNANTGFPAACRLGQQRRRRLGRGTYVAAERNDPDVLADERLPFAALAGADL